ncbi:DLA class II histocompatibility antigen, DR-1 beta chain-like [Onychostoma macrolepis]|uniref:DLA class II histocompatibility antigen, DR-1 beta chain-like n=1 Tax=Onychostoma macrolepis TaxID=369639 RepID=UPI00272B8A05|nr:DLA class II histocompatibility antigen, DR-1 beta chain-like [Onychostoma macrolepis]
MNIRLDRITIENQISSGIRPNGDGSFQMRISVEIDTNHKGSYECFVIHSSLTEPASVEWDVKCFNCETRTQWPILVAILVAAVALALAVYINEKKESNDLMRNHRCGYGAVSEQISMTGAACADTSDEELSADGFTDYRSLNYDPVYYVPLC